jgi:GNAT superfamily N-acetyltransferase
VQRKLDDFSSPVLIVAIEESLREFWENWGYAPQSELYASPNMLRLYTGVPYAFCNGVIYRQISINTIDSEIDETVSYYHARNATWEWIVGPKSASAFIDKKLEKHGLFAHGVSIGMAINLDAISLDSPSMDKLSIVQANDDDTLKIWANTMVEGFESPVLNPSFVDLECSLGQYQQSYRRYVGLLDQRPVSTSALYLGANVAGVYCVSTLPAARRMGIGATITMYALHEALTMGYHIAVLQSTQMGYKVYQRLGFKEFSTLRAYRPEK